LFLAECISKALEFFIFFAILIMRLAEMMLELQAITIVSVIPVLLLSKTAAKERNVAIALAVKFLLLAELVL
jgi:hypothetical protein